jgi:hypothetical protein
MDYDKDHDEEADESMANHQWSLTEFEKDKLDPGEVYCVECKCKRRSGRRMCTTCWDAYCDECYSYVHHVGALCTHKWIIYKKAKKRWMCVKGHVGGEQVYYVKTESL